MFCPFSNNFCSALKAMFLDKLKCMPLSPNDDTFGRGGGSKIGKKVLRIIWLAPNNNLIKARKKN